MAQRQTGHPVTVRSAGLNLGPPGPYLFGKTLEPKLPLVDKLALFMNAVVISV